MRNKMKRKNSLFIRKNLLALAVTSVSVAHANEIVISGTNTHFAEIGGKEVLNIAEPSNGLSHNKFEKFNVSQQGLIINNNPRLNAQLNDNAARIILNEVVGDFSSNLQGNTKIIGNSAEYILANPNGINCNGCSFENMHTATLTTGTPFFDEADGTLKGFDVRTGEVHIQDGGLDYKSTNYFNIISPRGC
jgi:filamentous hemagglutinin